MGMNRIQFQEGMSLFEFFQRWGDEAQCEAAVEQARWPAGFRCPRCGETAHCVLRAKARKTFQCNGCHQQTSVIAGTLFEGTKLALTVWVLAMYLISQAKTGLSALALKRAVGVSYRTAWLLHHKLMQAMVEREGGYQLSGKVQLDDAYLGGECSDGTVGRGASNKVPFVAAVQVDKHGPPAAGQVCPTAGVHTQGNCPLGE
jgi:transposase-like protein